MYINTTDKLLIVHMHTYTTYINETHLNSFQHLLSAFKTLLCVHCDIHHCLPSPPRFTSGGATSHRRGAVDKLLPLLTLPTSLPLSEDKQSGNSTTSD